MNFTVVREHREFFRKHHWIECDSVISEAEIKQAVEQIPLTLKKRLKEKGYLSTKTPPQFYWFEKGIDLWRESPILKKIALSRRLAEIAGELTEQKPLRFGYDKLLPEPTQE